jgi:hypothetical protein
MFKLIGLKPPKANPRAFIVVTETGAQWANERGVITAPVAVGTIQRTAEGSYALGEAALLASLALTCIERMEARLTQQITTLANRPGGAEVAAAPRRRRVAG